jgi:hypothetical protein
MALLSDLSVDWGTQALGLIGTTRSACRGSA